MNTKFRVAVILLICCTIVMAQAGSAAAQQKGFGAVVNTMAVAGTMWALGGLVGCVPCVIGGGLLALGAGGLRYFLL